MRPEKHPYHCTDCDGSGEVECPCCDNEVTCGDCDGSGFNHLKVDIERWQDASSVFLREHGCSWAWIENKKYMGQENNSGRLAISDYLYKFTRAAK